jgi:hypothetical protein
MTYTAVGSSNGYTEVKKQDRELYKRRRDCKQQLRNPNYKKLGSKVFGCNAIQVGSPAVFRTNACID